jgi:predicted NBD/HSP70 family sugar kinase/putative N-acetylmannosamine-6-phosphate epimerase
MDDTETLRRVAASALRGGGSGLRVNSPEHVAVMRRDTDVPIIGIQKRYLGGELRITPDFASAAELAAAGADIVAMDCTDRPYLHGEPWREILQRIRAELDVLVMADISTYAEGMAAAEAGAGLVGTTLHGYTKETAGGGRGFNWELLRKLADDCGRPVVAEGNIATPEEARRALREGAWCVVVGSAITRPRNIAAGFARALASEDSLRYAVGIDIGGTSVKGVIVDGAGRMTHPVSVPTEARGGREVIAASTSEAISLTLAAAADAGVTPAVIGVASAGAIDAQRGVVFAATENLPGWAGFDLRGFIEDQFGLPAYVENDAHAAALAELYFGVGRTLTNFVAMTLGTGVGGGIVVDGRLIRGAVGFAGTVGHQTIRFDGRQCNCGRRGCLEAYVSTAALVGEYRSASGAAPVEGESDAQVAMRIGKLAERRDGAALAAYDALAGYLAEGIANLFNVLDPDAIVLSGGLIESQIRFMANVEARVTELLHFGSKRAPRILRSTVAVYAGAQGAAAAALKGEIARKGL